MASVSAYYDSRNRLGYTSEIDLLDLLWKTVTAPNAYAFSMAMTLQEWLLVASYLLGVIVFIRTSNQRSSMLRSVTFGANLVIFPFGWVGIGLIPITVIDGIDGEWLGEHWPTMMAAGLWILISIAMLLFGVPARPAKRVPS